MYRNLFLNFPSQFLEGVSYQEQVKALYEMICALSGNIPSEINGAITEWIEKNYNELFFNASYDQATETITFAKGGVN